MKRDEILSRLGLRIPPAAGVRVIVDTDAKNEADDQYAIMHHLLSPMLNVRGIVAAHFESKAAVSGETMEKSFREVLRLLELAGIDDIPVYRGCALPLSCESDAPASPGVDFIISEARREDARPLYIAVQGTLTNVAAALNRAPDIGERLTVIWNGGGPYPQGREEFNLMQDINAARVLLKSSAAVWQTPQNVYSTLEVSLAELAARVRPCGRLGEYLLDQLMEENFREYDPAFPLRTGENWTLGDNATAAVLLQTPLRRNWITRPAPAINDDMTYRDDPEGKLIRVYTSIDVRLTLEDLFSKLALCYGKEKGSLLWEGSHVNKTQSNK